MPLERTSVLLFCRSLGCIFPACFTHSPTPPFTRTVDPQQQALYSQPHVRFPVRTGSSRARASAALLLLFSHLPLLRTADDCRCRVQTDCRVLRPRAYRTREPEPLHHFTTTVDTTHLHPLNQATRVKSNSWFLSDRERGWDGLVCIVRCEA